MPDKNLTYPLTSIDLDDAGKKTEEIDLFKKNIDDIHSKTIIPSAITLFFILLVSGMFSGIIYEEVNVANWIYTLFLKNLLVCWGFPAIFLMAICCIAIPIVFLIGCINYSQNIIFSLPFFKKRKTHQQKQILAIEQSIKENKQHLANTFTAEHYQLIIDFLNINKPDIEHSDMHNYYSLCATLKNAYQTEDYVTVSKTLQELINEITFDISPKDTLMNKIKSLL